MHKVWILISGLAIVVLIGGTAYFLKLPVNPDMPQTAALQLPAGNTPWPAVPDANPLLTADARQWSLWVPVYPIPCGEIVFKNVDTKNQQFEFCVDEIRRRVASWTGRPLRRDEVLDTRAKAQWIRMMGDL